MKVFAENFRGFRRLEVDLSNFSFLVGDNSSGKSSILHLVDSVLRCGLDSPPRLNEDLGVGQFDYFSPFFDEADVTFGLQREAAGKKYSKFITVRRVAGQTPSVLNCTYLSENLAIGLRHRGGNSQIRIEQGSQDFTLDSMLLCHKAVSGFQNRAKLPGGIAISDASAFFYLVDSDERKIAEMEIAAMLFGGAGPMARIVSPIRALPERFYSFNRKSSVHGLHFASMWHDYSKARWPKSIAEIEAFGHESKLFDSIQVEKVARHMPDSPLTVSVVKSGRKFLVNQVGVGVSQVVPVLIETAFALNASPKRPVLFQQPELHLHPVAQAALGTFFYKAARSGLRGLLETHSSFLIDRFRADLRDDHTNLEEAKQSRFPASILFCQNGAHGNSVCEIEIDSSGSLVEAPDAFHSFFVDELMRTMF